MKPDIHPKLNPVVFVDASSGQEFISRSTMSSKQTKDVNGVEQRGNAKEGRVELFNRRFKKKKEG
jgi:ribosomal protein L31